MTPQIRLNQFINAIVIGVLFQMLILFFLDAILNIVLFEELKSLDSGILIAGFIILSFPSWRLVSNFVGFILEPVATTKSFKNLYIKIIFGIKTEKEEGRVQLLKSIINGNSTLTNWQKARMEEYFKIELSKLSDDELYKLFEIIKGIVNVNPSEYQGQQSEQHNLVSNFHARLAVLANFGFWLSITSLVIEIFGITQYHWYNYIVAAFSFFVFGRHFGQNTDTKSEGYRLVIADFLAILTKQRHEQIETNR